MSIHKVDKLMSEARRIAAEYRRATGNPLGISAEIAQHDACTLLDLAPCNDTSAGYDAIGKGAREGVHIQIKGRAIFDESKGGQRIGQLKVEQEWDSVMLVIMDENFETEAIYEANRDEINEALQESGTGKRSKRGAMSIARFKNISQLVWTRGEGVINDEVWDNQADG